MLQDPIGHPSKMLLLFEFAQSFCFQFRLSRYYDTQSDIRVKSYYCLNLLRAFVFNFERHDILKDPIGHPSKQLLSFEFGTSFHFQLRASRYITGLNQTSE